MKTFVSTGTVVIFYLIKEIIVAIFIISYLEQLLNKFLQGYIHLHSESELEEVHEKL